MRHAVTTLLFVATLTGGFGVVHADVVVGQLDVSYVLPITQDPSQGNYVYRSGGYIGPATGGAVVHLWAMYTGNTTSPYNGFEYYFTFYDTEEHALAAYNSGGGGPGSIGTCDFIDANGYPPPTNACTIPGSGTVYGVLDALSIGAYNPSPQFYGIRYASAPFLTGTFTHDSQQLADNSFPSFALYTGDTPPAPSPTYGATSTLDFSAITSTTSLLFAYPPSWQSTSSPYSLLYLTAGTSTIDWRAIATTSALLPSSSCDDAEGFLASAVCRVSTYLFLPSPSTLVQWDGLPQQLGTKFPFSWFLTVPSVLNSLQAASSTMVTTTLSLHALGIGSTTPVGNILPTFDGLSSSTVMRFFPSADFAAMRALAAAALWIGFITDVFFTVRHQLV